MNFQGSVRQFLKEKLEIRHGQSSKAIEVKLRSAAFDVLSRCCEDEKAAFAAAASPPDWLDQEACVAIGWDVLVMMGRKSVIDPRPPLPEKVPDKHSRKTAKVCKKSRGFDFFMWLNADEIDVALTDASRTLKYAGHKRVAQRKMMAAAMWKKLEYNEKQAYSDRAAKLPAREKGSDGKWKPGSFVPDPDIPDAPAGAPGSSGDAVRPWLAHALVFPPARPAEVTPKKTKKALSRHGPAVLASIAELLQDPETPPKAKAAVAGVLSKTAEANPGMKKAFRGHAMARWMDPDRPKLGRPKGSRKVSDEMLTQQLEAVSTESSRMSNKLMKPIMTLNCSKRRAAVSTSLKRSQLQLRTRSCALGFAPSLTQRGKCDACHIYMSGARNKLQASHTEGRDRIRLVLPGYFDTFDPDHVEHDPWELLNIDDPAYIHALVEFVEGHAVAFAELRAGLCEEAMVELTAVEFLFKSALEEAREDVANMHWHLSLKHTLECAWERDWRTPADQTLYILWDHMAFSA